MRKKKNALIIGANSQDGKYLTKLLLKNNYKIYVLFNRNRTKIDKKLFELKLNLNHNLKIQKFLRKFNHLEIYYFPSINIDSNQIENNEVFIKNFDLNFVKLNNLLYSITKIKNKKNIKLFYSSSSHIFKGSKIKGKQSEETNYLTNTFYGFSKLCGLRLCEFYREKFKIFVSVGILYSHFSKYTSENFIIPKIYKQLKKYDSINILNENANLDFLHPSQVVRIIYKIINLKRPHTVIISSGKKIKINKICITLGKLLKKKKIKIISKKRKVSSYELVGNISKLKKLIKINNYDLSLKKNLSDFIYE